MRKFLAIVKHEYKKIVLKWAFLIGTLIFPLIAIGFGIIPAIIFSIKGEATRIVIVDQNGKVAPRVKENLSPEKMMAKAQKAASETFKDIDASQEEKMKRNAEQFGQTFVFVDFDAGAKPLDVVRQELLAKVGADEIDAYLIIPKDIGADAVFEFRSRKGDDFITNETLEDALNQAVRSQRLADANISESQLARLSENVVFDKKKIDEHGGEKESGGAFAASFIIGMMIYITLAIYGQVIMGAVVEEKETRIAEILFSSARPLELMLGKLVGVGLAALTQLAIWITSALVLIAFGAAAIGGAEFAASIPAITPLMVAYFFIFFLLGFFIYASIFALIGAMVTTVQEGGQFAFPPIMLLVVSFLFSFAVIRDPNSSMSFWVSIAPFFAPITMPVRILAETPPFWQVALAIVINGSAIVLLVWLASRVYRVGMLMYGKRATIPEVWKWIRQS
jgi:ABC-2 type transport system permease protein